MATERLIDYVLPDQNEGEARKVLRLIISEMNALQHARWGRLKRETKQWVEDELGFSSDDEEENDRLPEELQDRREQGYRRCAMLATLKKVQIGECAADAEEPVEWQDSELPKEWEGIDGFLNEVPWQLSATWMLVAAQCNPGAFFAEATDPKKVNPAPVSVRLLTKRLTIS